MTLIEVRDRHGRVGQLDFPFVGDLLDLDPQFAADITDACWDGPREPKPGETVRIGGVELISLGTVQTTIGHWLRFMKAGPSWDTPRRWGQEG